MLVVSNLVAEHGDVRKHWLHWEKSRRMRFVTELFDPLSRFLRMKQFIRITTLPLAAAALVITGLAVSQAPEGDILVQNSGQTIIYKDPDGAWPGNSKRAGPNQYTHYELPVPPRPSTRGHWI
jgi:hypothetical protein